MVNEIAICFSSLLRIFKCKSMKTLTSGRPSTTLIIKKTAAITAQFKV